MIRKYNYTGRRRIPREAVSISIVGPDDDRAFEARLNLQSMRFPADSRVVIEAYRGMSVTRFDFGHVRLIQPPGDRSLSGIVDQVDPLFRVKVVDPDGTGRLLGLADQLRGIRTNADLTTYRESLLPLRVTDLGKRVWRVAFDDAEPILEVNGEVAGIDDLAVKNGSFRSLVYPSAVQQIFTQMLFVDRYTDEESEPWHRWVVFAGSFFSEPYPDPEDDVTVLVTWIDGAVNAFAKRIAATDDFQADLKKTVTL